VPAHNASERAVQRRLREQMRGSGMSYAEIAAEMARRYQFRPRKAWRAAWGWTLEEAAEWYNALRAKGADEAVTSLTGSRLSEWENWPLNTRKPSFLSLCLLAEIYHCPVLDLIDFRDREHLPPGELLALDKTGTGLPQVEGGPGAQRDRRPDPVRQMTIMDQLSSQDEVPEDQEPFAAGVSAASALVTQSPALAWPGNDPVVLADQISELVTWAEADRLTSWITSSNTTDEAIERIAQITVELAAVHARQPRATCGKA
jgi:hypothetical protein